MKVDSEEGLEQKLIGSNKKKSVSSVKSSHSSQRSDRDTRGNSLGFLGQAGLLIYKNLILTFKNPKNLVFLILTPFLLSTFLYLFQDLARSNGSRTRIQTEEFPITALPHCYGENCKSLDYRIISNTPN